MRERRGSSGRNAALLGVALLAGCAAVALLSGQSSTYELSARGRGDAHLSRTSAGIARLEEKLGRVVKRHLSKLGQYDVCYPPCRSCESEQCAVEKL
jgi:hypothetical protein